MLYCQHVFWTLRAGPALYGTICKQIESIIYRCDHRAECVHEDQLIRY